MTQKEFARFFKEHIGEDKTFKQADKDIRAFLECLERVFKETEEDRIVIPGYGQFILQTRKPRKIKHPRTHEFMMLPERKQVIFKVSPALYARINKSK